MTNITDEQVRTLQYTHGYYDGVQDMRPNSMLEYSEEYVMGYSDGQADVEDMNAFTTEYHNLVDNAWKMFQKAQTVLL